MDNDNRSALMVPLCNKKRQKMGLSYPRTCVKCGLFGKCTEVPEEPKTSTPVLDVSGLDFTQPEIDCENGDC